MLALALFVGAAAARAEDFNFTVPVQVANLPPNVEGLTVTCSALKPKRHDGSRPGRTWEDRGPASVRVTIAGGAYRGDVIVRVNAGPGQDPRAATLLPVRRGVRRPRARRGDAILR